MRLLTFYLPKIQLKKLIFFYNFLAIFKINLYFTTMSTITECERTEGYVASCP